MEIQLRIRPDGLLEPVGDLASKFILESPPRLVFSAEIKVAKKPRTLTQNAALHKFCDLLAIELNNAGLDMKKTLKADAEIPWRPESVKEHLWRPIQKAVIDKESTTEADTSDYSKVYNVLIRHISQKFGVYVPWPSKRG